MTMVISKKNPQEVIDEAKDLRRLIELLKSPDGKYVRNALWSQSEKTVVFLILVVDRYDRAHFIDTAKTLIELDPVKDYFDVLESYNSRVNDQIILGLTWTGLSAIFLLLGGDIMFRIHLRESRIDKWFIDKSEFDLDPI